MMDTNKEITEFSWDVVYPKPGYWHQTIPLFILLFPIAIWVGYIIYNFTRTLEYLDKNFILVLMWIFDGLVYLTIPTLWYLIRKTFPPKLESYKVSAEGLLGPKQTIPLSEFKNDVSKTKLLEIALPNAEWLQPKPLDKTFLELELSANASKVKLLFSEEYIRQKCIRILINHLYPELKEPLYEDELLNKVE